MATFVKIDSSAPTPGRDPKHVDIKIDVGRTLALLLIALLILGVAAGLYFAEKDAPAFAFFTLGEAVLVSGFGLAIGAREGAQEAAQKVG
ncbi:MAG TPA: hypothetical protein VF533_05665 [Solirubrobacteraceae bacterium]|jgi:ABC-type sugar transport system substrate-binding protein